MSDRIIINISETVPGRIRLEEKDPDGVAFESFLTNRLDADAKVLSFPRIIDAYNDLNSKTAEELQRIGFIVVQDQICVYPATPEIELTPLHKKLRDTAYGQDHINRGKIFLRDIRKNFSLAANVQYYLYTLQGRPEGNLDMNGTSDMGGIDGLISRTHDAGFELTPME